MNRDLYIHPEFLEPPLVLLYRAPQDEEEGEPTLLLTLTRAEMNELVVQWLSGPPGPPGMTGPMGPSR
jgi:hypothetical protein